MPRWSQRRSLRLLTLGAGALILVAGAAYGWAWLSTDSSTIARALIWMESDVGDQHRFPARPIPAGERASRLPAGGEAELLAPDLDADGRATVLDGLLRETDTHAFAVAHEDRLVYERYFGGSDRGTLETSFSVAKSFVSTLVGIAIEEGLIRGVDDPVTDYLPELAVRDPRFERITLRDLLTMSSGLRYSEPDLPWPWSDDTYTYYGVDLREVALERSEVEGPPGQKWHYNNYNPLLLDLVLERATGMSVSDYMATRLWQSLGAGSDATWNLDSERSGFEKMESGLNATAVDSLASGCSSFTAAGGRASAWSPKSGYGPPPPPRPRPTTTTHTATSGGSMPNGRGTSTPSGSTGNTSTWPQTQTPSSSAPAATGESTTRPGWPSSATSATNSLVSY